MSTKIIATISLAISLVIASGCNRQPAQEESTDEYFGILLRNIQVPTGNMPQDEAKFTIYLPADWASSGKKYPVLYLLHGMWSSNNEWYEKGGVTNATKKLIMEGKCPEVVVVTPNCPDAFYVDGFKAGYNYESFFFNDFVPYLEANYPILTDREHTAIAGLSMGGYGTVYYGFKYPEKYCLAYSMSGAVGGMGSKKCPSLQQIFEDNGYTKDTEGLPELYLECGTEDSSCWSANEWTHAYLESIEYPHNFIAREGIHDWKFWTECYPKALEAFGALLLK